MVLEQPEALGAPTMATAPAQQARMESGAQQAPTESLRRWKEIYNYYGGPDMKNVSHCVCAHPLHTVRCSRSTKPEFGVAKLGAGCPGKIGGYKMRVIRSFGAEFMFILTYSCIYS